jgi:hypothetical protein
MLMIFRQLTAIFLTRSTSDQITKSVYLWNATLRLISQFILCIPIITVKVYISFKNERLISPFPNKSVLRIIDYYFRYVKEQHRSRSQRISITN